MMSSKPIRAPLSFALASCLIFFSMLISHEPLQAAVQENEILVHLDTEVPLLPLYLSTIETPQNGSLSKEHLSSIRDILSFDLNYNGSTKVLTPKEVQKLSSLSGQDSFDVSLDFDKIKRDGILYIIKLKTTDNSLSAKVISTNAQSAQTIDNIRLSGDLSKDRTTIHALSDAIHRALFEKQGIASCKLLFTIKKTVPSQSKGLEAKVVSEVFESDYDGKNARQLTHEGTLCANPSYIPTQQGQRPAAFCFVSYKIGQPKIYYANLKDPRPRRVSPLKGNQLTPSLSNDGRNVLFACDNTGTSDIFLQQFKKEIGPIGKPRHIFAAKGAAQASPVFSPDGSKIAFVSDKDGAPKIYIMSLPQEGTKLKDLKPILITKRCRENSAPTWSPDGKKLAYSAKNSGPRQIWIYDIETHKERELTQGKSIKENPVWAPDSLHLLFNAKDGTISDLYLVNLNQPEAVKITSGSFDKMFPSWEPLNLE
jgi:TolB protein